MPKRIQLRRSHGWRMPPNTVKVDRSTRWGNPFRPTPVYSRDEAVADYGRWLMGDHVGTDFQPPPSVEEIRRHLSGKNLGCWCPLDGPCHANLLLRLANSDG